jgi:hypothetical protein
MTLTTKQGLGLVAFKILVEANIFLIVCAFRQQVLPEQLIVAQVVKNFPASY